MKSAAEQARSYLHSFKHGRYVFGLGCYGKLGDLVRQHGDSAALITTGLGLPWGEELLAVTSRSLVAAGVRLSGAPIEGARPNTPSEDVQRIADELQVRKAKVVVCAGGGSTIDGAKAALALLTLRDNYPDFTTYFGTGLVSRMLEAEGGTLPPLVAVQTAASSGAHLTKYANITFTGAQKKLIIDDALVPRESLFDYALTVSAPLSLTIDGGLDGFSHALEVLYGASATTLPTIAPIATTAMRLLLRSLEEVLSEPSSPSAREGLGLGTDLGAYLIMTGGTNGGHLTSFSLVDILSHGRGCALMNPYYTVLFSASIQEQLKLVAGVLAESGYCDKGTASLRGRSLGTAVAQGLIRILERVGAPTKLDDVPGFVEGHIVRALKAAKDPQLESKLKNMPTPLATSDVDEYIGSILEAARWGDLSLVKGFGKHARS